MPSERVQGACKRRPVAACAPETGGSSPFAANLMAADSERPPLLIVNPPDDAAFRKLATRLIDEGVRLPALLQGRLRERHPHAIVRPRDLVGEQTPVWYVYRDGRWVGSGT